MAALQKIPIQIRLDLDEVALLDQYVASFADFPPTRVAVVHRALREWLTQKTAVPPAGPAVPTALETAGREAAPVPADAPAPESLLSVHTGLDPETLEELPPAPPEGLPAILPASDADGSPRPIVVSDEDVRPAAPLPTKRPGVSKSPLSRKGAPRTGRKGTAK